MAKNLGVVWGIIGVVILLGSAVCRLTPLAISAFSTNFSWFHWLALAGCILFMAYSEGYKGFQLQFSPRVIARALYLRDHPRVVHIVFAPLFCMGYFHATRRRKTISYSLTAGIIALVMAVRHISQPWRGIIDAGVVIGLIWGIVSLLWIAMAVVNGHRLECSPEVPDKSAQPTR
ncbi:MAG TPA: hypothetical protein VMC44_01150 [Geobacteraceae bacterium]|nr:hypothetical protein [Geobacteraceae bacterium]